MSLTTDRNDPDLRIVQPSGMQKKYLVLSEEERAKGFIRPVRQKYVHVGRIPSYKGLYRMLDKKELDEYIMQGKFYVAIMTVITHEDGSFMGGSYVTQEELDAYNNGTRIGGCGGVTTMGLALSETYARQPNFYSATFCAICGSHFPVGEHGEFVWDGTNEMVGT